MGQTIVGKISIPPSPGNHNNGTVNVRSFGAKGDGVSNDTAAIKKAIATGKAVYFPSGTYLLFEQLNVTQDFCLFGDGEKSVIKLAPYDQSRPEEYEGNTVYNVYMLAVSEDAPVRVELQDIVLDANKADYEADALRNGSSKNDHTTCIDLKKPTSVKMRNVTIKNALIEGAYIWCGENTEYVQIDNCRFLNNGYYQEDASGLHVEGDLGNVVVANCIFARNGFHGLLIAGNNGKFNNITAHDNGWDGVCLWGCASYNLLSNIYSYYNRGGIHIKCNYSSWITDDDAWDSAKGNMLNNICTKDNTYGLLLGANEGTKICGFRSEDEYCYALVNTLAASGNIIHESFNCKTAYGTDYIGGGVNNFTLDFTKALAQTYPAG